MNHVLFTLGAALLKANGHTEKGTHYLYKAVCLEGFWGGLVMEQATPKKSKKGLIIGIILLVLIAGGAYAFYAATSSSTVPAMVRVDDGSVTLNGRVITGNEKLDEGDTVATQNGHATIFLYESVVMALEPNTKVSITELLKEHPTVSQDGGTTWSTFTKLAGVEDYSATMGSTVASVRGTAFELSEGYILTGEGTVEYTFDGQSFSVDAGKVVEEGVSRDATPEERSRIVSHLQNAVDELQYLRQLELEKHPLLVSAAKSAYGIDDATISQKLEEADAGLWDVDQARAHAPMQLDSLDKIADITKAIQKINRDIQALNG